MSESPTCSNPDCQVAVNGSCLEGHDPVKSCPNFGKAPSIETPDATKAESPDTATETETRKPKLKLASGQQLSQREVDAFQLRREARLVAVVGDTSSGKSTLLCSIYDRFQRGTFAKRSFAASSTLGALEELAHLSRAASGALKPDTKRTYLSEGLQYYHLATAPNPEPGPRFDLFMSDRAGETYRSGMHRPDELRELPELGLARVVAVLIDGARLAVTEEQHEVLDSARRIVRAMIDAGVLRTTQHLQVVLTKRDEIERSGDAADLIQRLKSLVDRLKSDFGSKLASVSFFEIAARDPLGTFDPAYGCDVLLESWISAAEPSTSVVEPDEIEETQFDRLGTQNNSGAWA